MDTPDQLDDAIKTALDGSHIPAVVETYGELPGEDQYSEESELALVGQMVDASRVTVQSGRVEMELFLAF